MEFDEAYNDVLQSYPDIIDISDGELISETSGFNAPKLTSYYEHAELVKSSKGEWHSLITWIMFQVLHEAARNHYIQGKFVLKKEVDKARFRKLLITNLQTEEFEDMFKEFVAYENSNGIFN
jgi:hypothetical protein